MVRTLFWLEAIILAVFAVLASVIGRLGAREIFLPAIAIFLLPLAGAAAIWPPVDVVKAFFRAFSSRGPVTEDSPSIEILESLGSFSILGAIIYCLAATRILLDISAASAFEEAWRIAAFALLGSLYALSLSVLRQAVESGQVVSIPARVAPSPDLIGLVAAYGLSPRESEIASCLVRGLSYKETADRLFISIKTVKTHVTHIYAKTSCPNRVALLLLLAHPENWKIE